MKTLLSLFVFVFLSFFFMSCAQKTNTTRPEIVLEKVGSDMETIQCKFNPSKQAVENFFLSAKPISPQEEHQMYGWSPCFAEGKWKDGEQWRSFKLRPTGSAQIQLEEDKFQLLGCVECVQQLNQFQN